MAVDILYYPLCNLLSLGNGRTAANSHRQIGRKQDFGGVIFQPYSHLYLGKAIAILKGFALAPPL